MKIGRNIPQWAAVVARTVVGAVLVFSSVVKALDPYGTVLKLEEYLVAVGWHSMGEIATFGAVALVCVEMLIGGALLLGAMPKLTAKVALVLNGLFLALTLWVAIANPVAECGCFGDVVRLTNWQTFAKNVVLVVLTLVALWGAGERGAKWRSVGALVAMVGVLALATYSLIRLPLVEKFPFGVGVNLVEAVSEEVVEDEVFVVCREVATGNERTFSVNDEEWWDESKWEYLRTNAPEEKGGVRVSARDFKLYVDDYDITAQILMMPLCRLVCVESVERLSDDNLKKLRTIANECIDRGERVVVVSASPLSRVERKFPNMEICNMDAVALRALLRARAGIVTLQRGTVVHKVTVAAVKGNE